MSPGLRALFPQGEIARRHCDGGERELLSARFAPGLSSLAAMLGRSQAVRQRILIPPYGGSNPPAPANDFSSLPFRCSMRQLDVGPLSDFAAWEPANKLRRTVCVDRHDSQAHLRPPAQLTGRDRKIEAPPSARRVSSEGPRIDNFLTDRARVCYCFSEFSGALAGRFMGPGRARDSARNEMGVKPLKTNNSAKWSISPPSMISITYGRGAKPFVSLNEMRPVDFAGFPRRRGAKSGPTKSMTASGLAGLTPRPHASRSPQSGRLEGWSRRAFGAPRGARSEEGLGSGCESEMAPHAIGIAQNRLANGARANFLWMSFEARRNRLKRRDSDSRAAPPAAA